MAQVLASTPEQGDWNTLEANDITFLERYFGSRIGLGLSVNPSSDAISAVSDGLTAAWNELNKLAVRVAAQGPLESFFAGVAYDVQSDVFRPTTNQQLVPMLEAIFNAAPSASADAADFIGRWKDIINVMLPDLHRDDFGRVVTNPYLFQNLVGAYENVPIAISLQAAASLFDIPTSIIKTGSGTIVGADNALDIFYLDSTDQVLVGRGGQDSYVVGYNFGQDVIRDVWEGYGDSQEDAIRFAHLNANELSFRRDGLDLVISQIGTDNEIRVVDEFAGRRPGLVTAFMDFDKSIEIITFADGTVWDKIDIARTVGMPSYPTNDTLIGTPDVDFLNGGIGTDFMSGGDGGDHYIFGRGDGHDTILEGQGWIWMETPDFLHFEKGVTLSDLWFQRTGNSNDSASSS
jgi:Ca2+-binding RTX toxin-like protein